MAPLNPSDLLAALLRQAAAEALPLARLDGAADPAAPIAGRDADLLAGWRPWPVWLRLVRRAAEAAGWRLCLAVPRGSVMMLFLAARDENEPPECLQIDLHRDLSARGLPFARADAVLAVAQAENGALRLDPALAAELRARGKALVSAGGGAWLALLADAVRHRPDIALRLWRAKLRDASHRLVAPPGRWIAVSGPDGAGKTALIERLGRHLPRRLAPEVRLFHTRPFLLPRLGLSAPAAPAAMAARSTGPVRSRLRLALAWADWWIGHALLVRPHLMAGRMVLFDRHASDYRVDPQRRGIDLPAAALRLLERVPRPALSFVLIATPAQLVGRKGELDPAEAERQVAAYRALAATTPRTVLLDSSDGDPDRLAATACRHIATMLGDDAHPSGA